MKINFTKMFMFTVFLVFMICGTYTLQAQAALTINSPANIAGTYTNVGDASFGPQLADIGPITGNLVASDSLDGCNSFINAAAVMGNIALIDRGNCSFDDKTANAEAAGAIAVIICLVNDAEPFSMFGDADTLAIPSIMITQSLCDQIRMELPGVNVTMAPAGCTDAIGCNFDAAATVDNGSCVFPGDACDDEDPFTTNDSLQPDCSCAGVYNPDLEATCFEPNIGNVIPTDGIEGPFGIISIDMDGDGDDDILASFSRVDGRIVWYENDGQGNFGSQNIIDVDISFPRNIAATDIDSDGDNDVIAGVSVDGGSVVWYENDGQGNFGSQNIIAMSDGIGGAGVFSIDIDGDGNSDVLAGNVGASAKVAWYENDGQGNFGSENIISADAIGVAANFAADLDGDGDNDVLTTASFEDKIAWYENDGQGNFGSEIIIVSDVDNPIIILATDLDGDGDNDVISHSNGNDKIAWYENDGQGNFGSENIISISIIFANDIHIADIDGDGDNDLLVNDLVTNKLSLFENDGQGNFTETIIANLRFPTGIGSADFDGDGDQDVVAAGEDASGYIITWYENECKDGCINPDACNFDPEATDDDGSCFSVGDACDDEDPFTENDVIQADCSCVGVYNPDLEPTCYEVNEGIVISTDSIGAYDVIAVDMDGDGDQDILAATNKDQVLWYENDGQGNFSSENIIDPNVPFTVAVYAIDLDGDGDNDVLTTSFIDNKVVWYENDGQGNFSTENIVSTDLEDPVDVYAIDLDGDGDNDVLSSSRGSDDKFAWYENDGQGNFGSQNIIAMTTDIANDIHAADLDGDGNNDVLTTTIFNGEIAWYENDGQGGFGTGNIIAADPTNAAFLVDADDFDGDGDIDVLVANSFSSRLIWYENDGQGGFDAGNIITVTDGIPFGVCIIDIEGDGDSDILASFISPTNSKVSLYENDGQGGFTESIISSNLAGPWMACAADFDGDGDNDIIAADGGGFSPDGGSDGGVVWYENQCDEVTEETIPTLSDWGLIILGLILLNLGVLYIRQTEMRELVIGELGN